MISLLAVVLCIQTAKGAINPLKKSQGISVSSFFHNLISRILRRWALSYKAFSIDFSFL